MQTWMIPSFAVALMLALALPAPARNLGREIVPNGGFEQGAASWSFSGPYRQPSGPDAGLGAEIIATEARGGKQCLRIDTRGRDGEVNAHSDAFPVAPGAKYALSSAVRLIAPERSGFKVTIEWLDAEGKHLSYDNDWRGDASDHTWLQHGGDFTAPADAAQARIILGILPGAAMLFDDISLRDVGPCLEITTLAASAAICVAGDPAALQCVVRNSGGRAVLGARGALGLEGNLHTVHVGDLAPGEERLLSVEVSPAAPGTRLAQARFSSDNAPAVEKATPIVAIADDAQPGLRLSSGAAELRFIESGFGHGVIGVAVREGNDSSMLGAIRALAELGINDDPPRLIYAPLDENGNAIAGTWRSETCDLAFRFAPAAPGWFSIRCALTAKRDFALRALTCPEFHFGWRADGADKDSALLCGLEYLTAHEDSSGTESVAPRLAARFVPHPNKVTVPLMAVANRGWAAGLAWNPLQQWDGQHDRPSVVFASPNRLDRQDDHVMALFLPSIPDFVNENERAAARPYPVRAGQTITLESELFVLPAPRDICDVMPEWYRAHPLAELPDITRDHRAHWAHSIEGLTRGWSEEHKQWKPEAHRDHGFYPRIAVRLLNYGMRSESELAATALTQVRQAVEKAIADSGPGRIGLDLALHL
ncbi:MAG: carbohydrate binding domain-containing protein, partial [Armatimonadota bacterium]